MLLHQVDYTGLPGVAPLAPTLTASITRRARD